MSTLYIREYTGLSAGIDGRTAQAAIEPGFDQTVTVSGAHAESSAFGANTHLVRIHCDGVCSFVFGLAPVATTAAARLALGVSEFYSVSPGHKISAITNT